MDALTLVNRKQMTNDQSLALRIVDHVGILFSNAVSGLEGPDFNALEDIYEEIMHELSPEELEAHHARTIPTEDQINGLVSFKMAYPPFLSHKTKKPSGTNR